MTIGQPVEALVASVLDGEWTIVSDTENSLCLNHDTHKLELNFAKVVGGAIRMCDWEWMSIIEKHYVEEHLNDWWALKRKALDAERHAAARNKFMILVK